VARFLVAFDTIEGQTRKITDFIADRAVRRGHDVRRVVVTQLSPGAVPPGKDLM
jgi:menaquinone-dependent protoporphyrinogen IX oxidase